MFGLGIKEILTIILVLLLLFGLTKFPQLVRSLADTIKYLRGAFKNDEGGKGKK